MFWIEAVLTSVLAASTAAGSAPSSAKSTLPIPQFLPRADFLKKMDGDFATMDRNHDGKVVKSEIETFQSALQEQEIAAQNSALFAKLDADHNGNLTASEFARFRPHPARPNGTAMLEHFDSNKDGSVTRLEFRTGTLANFDRLDTDKDGMVSAAEMRADDANQKVRPKLH